MHGLNHRKLKKAVPIHMVPRMLAANLDLSIVILLCLHISNTHFIGRSRGAKGAEGVENMGK